MNIWKGTASDGVTELRVTVCTSKGQVEQAVLKEPIKAAGLIEKGAGGNLVNGITLERGIKRSSDALSLT